MRGKGYITTAVERHTLSACGGQRTATPHTLFQHQGASSEEGSPQARPSRRRGHRYPARRGSCPTMTDHDHIGGTEEAPMPYSAP